MDLCIMFNPSSFCGAKIIPKYFKEHWKKTGKLKKISWATLWLFKEIKESGGKRNWQKVNQAWINIHINVLFSLKRKMKSVILVLQDDFLPNFFLSYSYMILWLWQNATKIYYRHLCLSLEEYNITPLKSVIQ